jgi:1-acyl-sn-glycerol-3-phosphate acyltransferase
MLVTWNTDSSIWLARHAWAPFLLWAGGAKLTVEGLEHVDPARPTLYVSNHQSTIDIPVLFRAVDANLRFIAKRELQWVPVLGWYMWVARYVFVDRGNSARAIAALSAAAKRIREGTNLIVFPEGTRSSDRRVLPFKKGAFRLAIEAGAAICPVTIEGSGRLMPKSRWTITPGPIRVRIGAPIEASRYAPEQVEALIRCVRDEIIEQSLALGGLGGDRDEAVAARGREGVAEPTVEPRRRRAS